MSQGKMPKISIKFSPDNTTIELFNEFHIDSKIKSTACIPYLEHIFKTLSFKSASPANGMSKITFLKYANLPGIIGERLFTISDRNKDGFLNFVEFMTPIMKINSDEISIKMKLVFDLYDFAETNFINVNDIKTILIHCFPEASKLSQGNHTTIFVEQSKSL